MEGSEEERKQSAGALVKAGTRVIRCRWLLVTNLL